MISNEAKEGRSISLGKAMADLEGDRRVVERSLRDAQKVVSRLEDRLMKLDEQVEILKQERGLWKRG